MSLRIGCDMDGVLADFARAYCDIEVRLFGPADPPPPRTPDEERDDASRLDQEAPFATATQLSSRRAKIWHDIKSTADFWETLEPMEAGAVSRLHALSIQHRWEVFFITQRPATDGDTVQRQTQRWLIAQGFAMPSVLVVPGSRGAAGAALSLHYHVDDSPSNCVDIKTSSRARPVLIVDPRDTDAVTNARSLGIATAPGIGAALDILDQASAARARPRVLQQLAQMVGWK